MTPLSWVALQGMAPSFTELDKAVVHMIKLVSFCNCGFYCVCLRDKRLMEAPCWEKLTEGETVLVLMGGAMLSKSLIQFSVDGPSVFPPCCLT